MKPDVKHYNQDTDYLRGLLDKAGLSQREAARRLGIRQTALRAYLSGKTPCPYPVQYCLEQLAENSED